MFIANAGADSLLNGGQWELVDISSLATWLTSGLRVEYECFLKQCIFSPLCVYVLVFVCDLRRTVGSTQSLMIA